MRDSRNGPIHRVVVLGAGFGGLEVASRLSAEFADALDVVLIDRGEGFMFGFSKLDVMFGRTPPAAVHHRYRDLVKPGVRFVQAEVLEVDPVARRVRTDAGGFDADILVVGLGADLVPEATPGLVGGGHEFYTREGAFALRQLLAEFDGGDVVTAVTSTPFKCPPAPSETALLMDDLLRARGVRDRSTISLVMPLRAPIPPAPAASELLLREFAAREIGWLPDSLVRRVDPDRRVVILGDGARAGLHLDARRSGTSCSGRRCRVGADCGWVGAGGSAHAANPVPRRVRRWRRDQCRHAQGRCVRRGTSSGGGRANRGRGAWRGRD